MLVPITDRIAINEAELEESFVRASGPGGQNVNKLSTAVQLRFDLKGSPSLPEAVRERAIRLAGRRMNSEGVLVILAQQFRTQERNRADARARLIELLAAAAVPPPPPRRPTRATLGSVRRRLASKAKRGTVKALRGPDDGED